MTEIHILIVEDDPDISGPLAVFLSDKGFITHVAGSIETAEHVLEKERISLILLDVMLPGEDGLSFCRRAYSPEGPRIIMLTALSESMDKVIGLELGADAYVTKPFELRVLLAHIRALLRRPASNEMPSPPNGMLTQAMNFSEFTFEPQRRLLRSREGRRILLTGAEADLLFVLCQHPREILSRDQLIALTRGEGFPISTRSIDLLVSRLRRKLSGNAQDSLIRTVRTGGYIFQTDVVLS